MTSKRPTPLKDEPVTQFDELQELLAANLEAMETLNRNLCGRSDIKPLAPEVLEKRVATAARNAVRELLEERQRGVEREEEEDRTQGKLTPQECYARMAADFAEALEKYKLVCDAFGRTVKLTDFLNKTRDSYDTRVRLLNAKLDVVIEILGVHAAKVKKPVFPARPKRFKDIPVFVFKDAPLYCLRRAYRSRRVQRFVCICLLCVWFITIVTACLIIHDNAVMRKELQNSCWKSSIETIP